MVATARSSDNSMISIPSASINVLVSSTFFSSYHFLSLNNTTAARKYTEKNRKIGSKAGQSHILSSLQNPNPNKFG
jgi:hypothetical protein